MPELFFEGYQFSEKESHTRDKGFKSQHKVLLVEDELDSKLLVEVALKAIEDRVRINWVTNAEEAEGVLRKDHHYDLIIADHFLQGPETGLEFWRACSRHHRRIPFLLTSSLEPTVFSRLVAGEKEKPFFLHKPFRVDECRKLLEWFWGPDIATAPTGTTQKIPLFRRTTNVGLHSAYKTTALGLLSVAAIFFMAFQMQFINTEPKIPQAMTIPVINQRIENLALPVGAVPLSPSSGGDVKTQEIFHFSPTPLIREILKTDLGKKTLSVQWSGKDILESIGPNAETEKIYLPRTGMRLLLRGIRNSDGKFEKYGHLHRVA